MTSKEEYAEFAAIRAELKALLKRVEALGGKQPMYDGENSIDGVWAGIASAVDTLGPYGIGALRAGRNTSELCLPLILSL